MMGFLPFSIPPISGDKTGPCGLLICEPEASDGPWPAMTASHPPSRRWNLDGLPLFGTALHHPPVPRDLGLKGKEETGTSRSCGAACFACLRQRPRHNATVFPYSLTASRPGPLGAGQIFYINLCDGALPVTMSQGGKKILGFLFEFYLAFLEVLVKTHTYSDYRHQFLFVIWVSLYSCNGLRWPGQGVATDFCSSPIQRGKRSNRRCNSRRSAGREK